MRRAFCPIPIHSSTPAFCFLTRLRAGLLLLLLPESEQTDTGDLNDLEADTGNITLCLTLATETGKEDLVVLIDEVQATVIGDCKNMLVSTCLW